MMGGGKNLARMGTDRLPRELSDNRQHSLQIDSEQGKMLRRDPTEVLRL